MSSRDAQIRLFQGREHSPRGGGGHTSFLSQVREFIGGKIFASCLGHGQRGLSPPVQRIINPHPESPPKTTCTPCKHPLRHCRGHDFPQA